MKTVINENGVAVTTSLMIAEVFGKRHFHVIRDIEEYLKSGDLEMHPDLRASFSVKSSTYKDAYNRDKPMYMVGEDATILVVMGYTGRKAMDFKKAYITEFRRMREFIEMRESVMLDIDDERKVGDWESCRIEGFSGVLEELGLL